MLRRRVAKIHLEAIHPGLAYVFPVGIGERDRYFILLQRLGNGAGTTVGPQDQEAKGCRLCHTQGPGNRAGRQALQGNGGDDQHEHQRYQCTRVRVTLVFQLKRKQRGHRRCHDATGAIQLRNTFSRQFSEVPMADSRILTGRATSIRIARTATRPQPSSAMAPKSTRAARMINRAEIRRTLRTP